LSFNKFSPFEHGTATTPNTSLTRMLSGLLYHHHQHIGCSMNKMEQHQNSKFHCCPCGKLLVMILFQQWWYRLYWTKVQSRQVKTEIYGKTMNAKNFWCPPCLHNHDYYITLTYMCKFSFPTKVNWNSILPVFNKPCINVHLHTWKMYAYKLL